MIFRKIESDHSGVVEIVNEINHRVTSLKYIAKEMKIVEKEKKRTTKLIIKVDESIAKKK